MFATLSAPNVALQGAGSSGGITLFLMSGQSNMVGQGTTGQTPPSNIMGLNAKIWIPSPNPNGLISGSFQDYTPGVNAAPNGTNPAVWGPEGEFARRWCADNPGQTMYMVKPAVGSTGLDPTTGTPNWYPDTVSSLFSNSVIYVNLAINALVAAGKTVSEVHLVWMQGEKDASTGAFSQPAVANAYVTNLPYLFSKARLAVGTGWGVTKIIFGEIFVPVAVNPYADIVRSAQVTVEGSATNAWLDDLSYVITLGDYIDSGLHAGPLGIAFMGDQFYSSWKTGVQEGVIPAFTTSCTVSNAGLGQTPAANAAIVTGFATPTVTYQWYEDGSPIVGQNTLAWQGSPLSSGDVGKFLECRAFATNAGFSGMTGGSASANGTGQTVSAYTYSTWDSTIDPTDLAYSSGNQTVTLIGTPGIRSSRGLYGKTSGKWFYEAQANSQIPARFGVGTSVIGGAAGGVGGTSTFHVSGSTLTYTGGTTAMGRGLAALDTCQIAVDITNNLMWLREKPNGGSWGYWNNNASADPASGVGGVSISGRGSNALYPTGQLNNLSSAAITITTSGATPPSGFTPWSM